MNVLYEWDFGDDKGLAQTLKLLVMTKKKTATTSLYHDGMVVPHIGDRAGILDSNKKRFCVIEYTNVEIKPFLAVDYEYILKEGEGDKNIEEWRQKHRLFFRLKHDNVSVVCEEFRVVIEGTK